MRSIILFLILASCLAFSVSAAEPTAPIPPEDVLQLMPSTSTSFGQDLWFVIVSALENLQPAFAEGLAACGCVLGVCLLIAAFRSLPGRSTYVMDLVAVLAISGILLNLTGSMVELAINTLKELSAYGKMLLPVMTTALAAQGGITSSTALYTGTVIFDAILSTAISNLLVPMVYVLIILSVAFGATGEQMLSKLRDMVKWLVTWCLKLVLYIFTGYISITGVVSGTADAAAIKATKLTMSGVVPVVGNILADASEAVLVGAGVLKSAAGVYGLVAICAIWIAPFLRLGVQYLLLKLTAAFCGVFDQKKTTDLLQSFTGAMGLLLAMTGAECVVLLVSTVCFMKGVNG